MVSIHAQARRPRRRSSTCCASVPSRFQSTPGPVGPGDTRPWSAKEEGMFQSTPRPVGPGDALSPICLWTSSWFQSTPRPVGPGDPHRVAMRLDRHRFNPRPGP